MASGTPRFTCINRLLLVVLASFGLAVAAQAQQPVPEVQSVPTTAPANTQPFPSAALPAANPSATADSAAATKDSANLQVSQLGAGDLIELQVYNVPELATRARISLSGDVYLPLIDYVHIGGLTLEEAQALVEKRLQDGGFVRNPHVTIFVNEANSQGITILGDVGKPGVYPDPASRRLYTVISEAGGFLNTASRKIAIIRPNQPDAIRIDLPRNLSDDLSGDVEVLPGDTINVPRAPVIYVVGDVGRPTGLLVDNGTLTVLEALALAGGTNHTAKLGGARIIHKTPSGITEEPVHLKKMLEAKSPDITLKADDILFVPVSGLKIAATKTVDAAFALASAVGIYTVIH